jgi:hypothetical protein
MAGGEAVVGGRGTAGNGGARVLRWLAAGVA